MHIDNKQKGGLKLKTTVGIIMAVVVMFLVGMGGWWFGALALFALPIGLWEFYGFAEAKGARPHKILGFVAFVVFLVYLISGDFRTAGVTLTAFILISMAMEILRGPDESIKNASYTILGVIYVGLASYGVLLRNLKPNEMGIFFILMALAGSVFSDAGAMFTGKALGKRKLAPSISPGKTIEGTIGGVIIGILGSVVFNFACEVIFLDVDYLTVRQAAMLGLLNSVAGMSGDLVESMFKRDAGVKDSGSLFPEHGGVLDRLDSPIFTFATTYCFVIFAL